MKANELQIGDWVMLTDPINKGEKVQVKEIHGDGYIIVDGAITKMFEPIPLTAEILEKNGFVEEHHCSWLMFYMWSTGGVAEFADVTIGVSKDHADKWRWDCLTLNNEVHEYPIATKENIREALMSISDKRYEELWRETFGETYEEFVNKLLSQPPKKEVSNEARTNITDKGVANQ